MKNRIEALLETPYWIADILPERVEKDSPGQYFAVERYFLQPERLAAIKRRHAALILKLNCYRAVSLDEETEQNPDPERIADAVMSRRVCVLTGESMLVSEPDELYLTVYHPDDDLLARLRTLCAGEGMYLWKPED